MKTRRKSTLGTIYYFAQECREKMLLSILTAIISVAGGLVPYWGVYRLILLFFSESRTAGEIFFWTVICSGGYVVKLLFYGISTTLSHSINLMLPQGSFTALVGPSGSGKTTTCSLIARFYDADSGSVSIGDTDVRELSCDSLLKNISMVFQNVYLFNDTIVNNIKFGKPDAAMEEVIEAARKELSALTHGKTIIVIAHRLATIENADQILVLDGGRIVQQGTHGQLLTEDGIYSRFHAIRKQAEGWSIA